MTAFTWLSGPRQAAGLTQESVADQLAERTGTRLADKTIARWERGESGRSRALPYKELAEIVHTTEAQLYADHTRDLGLLQHEMKEEISAIRAALEACRPYGLVEKIQVMLNRKTTEEAAEALASILLSGDGARLPRCCNGPLEAALKAATDLDGIRRIRSFVGAIAAGAIHNSRSDPPPPGCSMVQDATQAWVIRILINSALGHGIEGIQVAAQPPDSDEVMPRFDPRSLNAVALPMRTKTDSDRPEDRVKELVGELGAVVKASLGKTGPQGGIAKDRFAEYCDQLNRLLLQKNPEVVNFFAFAKSCEKETVVDELQRTVPNLRFFMLGSNDPAGKIVLRVGENDLGDWLIYALNNLEVRQRMIRKTSTHYGDPTPTDLPAPASGTTVIIQRVSNAGNMAFGNNNAQYQFSDGIQGDDLTQLMHVLKQILAEASVEDSGERAVRNAARDIIEMHDEKGELPKEGRNWLEAAKNGLQISSQLVNLVDRASSLFDKFFPSGGCG